MANITYKEIPQFVSSDKDILLIFGRTKPFEVLL